MTLALARFVEIVGPSNDKGPYKLAQVTSDGSEITGYLAESSGFASNPLKGGIGIAIPIAGDEGKVVIIPMAPASGRYDGLKEGEAKIGNLKNGISAFFNDAGEIVLTGKVIIHGDVEINGNITHTGDNNQSGIHIDSNGPHTA